MKGERVQHSAYVEVPSLPHFSGYGQQLTWPADNAWPLLNIIFRNTGKELYIMRRNRKSVGKPTNI